MSVVDCLAQAAQSTANNFSSAAAASSTGASTSPGNRVIMKVGDKQVTQSQFEQLIADLEAMQGPADLNRKQLGEKFASLFILAQQAVADHLDSSPEVIRQLAIDRTQILSNAEFFKLKEAAKPTPEQISAYYNAHLEDYDVVTLRRVFIWEKGKGTAHPNGLTPEEANALAAAIKQAYASGSDPKKLIKDPDLVHVDDQPLPFQRGEMPAEMEKVAFVLQKPGEWIQVPNTPGSVVLLQLVSRSRRTLSEVTPQIEKKLQNEELRDELKALKTKTGVWMDETYFASKAPVPGSSTEPAAPGAGKSSTERGEQDERHP
ncbi:MAG: hypothetical protein ACLPPV_02710 [Candidatus Korobacteraceae bacterium]